MFEDTKFWQMRLFMLNFTGSRNTFPKYILSLLRVNFKKIISRGKRKESNDICVVFSIVNRTACDIEYAD